MPLKCKTKIRYRFRKTKKGKQRLAFCGNKVVEVKTFRKKNGRIIRTHMRRKPRWKVK